MSRVPVPCIHTWTHVRYGTLYHLYYTLGTLHIRYPYICIQIIKAGLIGTYLSLYSLYLNYKQLNCLVFLCGLQVFDLIYYWKGAFTCRLILPWPVKHTVLYWCPVPCTNSKYFRSGSMEPRQSGSMRIQIRIPIRRSRHSKSSIFTTFKIY